MILTIRNIHLYVINNARVNLLLVSLHPNEYTQGLRYYPFAVNLNRCTISCNTVNGISKRICIRIKTEDLNLNVFHMIKGINESKTLT